MFGWRINLLWRSSVLSSYASNQFAKVKDYMEKTNGQTVWTHLREDEESELIRLSGALNWVFIPKEGSDGRIWAPSKDGVFTVSSFFSIMSVAPTMHSHYDFLWKSKVPPKVFRFAWLVIRGDILTLDNPFLVAK